MPYGEWRIEAIFFGFGRRGTLIGRIWLVQSGIVIFLGDFGLSGIFVCLILCFMDCSIGSIISRLCTHAVGGILLAGNNDQQIFSLAPVLSFFFLSFTHLLSCSRIKIVWFLLQLKFGECESHVQTGPTLLFDVFGGRHILEQ